MKYYVLKSVDGNLIGVDVSSGGYPWEPGHLGSVKFWPYTEKGQKDAEEYNRTSNNRYELCEFTYQVVPVKLEVWKPRSA